MVVWILGIRTRLDEFEPLRPPSWLIDVLARIRRGRLVAFDERLPDSIAPWPFSGETTRANSIPKRTPNGAGGVRAERLQLDRAKSCQTWPGVRENEL